MNEPKSSTTVEADLARLSKGNICPTKAGSFRLQRPLLPPPCTVSAPPLVFNPPHNAMARFPVGYPNPGLPEALGVFPFAAPAGTYDWLVRTGHYTYPDDPQAHEQVKVELLGASGVLATLITDDVKDEEPTHTTVFHLVTTSAPVTGIRISHGYDGVVTMPDDSVTLESVAYACPGR